MGLREKGQPWFLDLKEELLAQKENPHFDIDEYIKKQMDLFATKGATAIFLYNTSTITDNVLLIKMIQLKLRQYL